MSSAESNEESHWTISAIFSSMNLSHNVHLNTMSLWWESWMYKFHLFQHPIFRCPLMSFGLTSPKMGKISFHKSCHGLLLAPSIPSSHPHLAQMWLWLPDTQLLQGVRQLQHRYVLFFIVSLMDYSLSLEVALSKGWRRRAWAGQITVRKLRRDELFEGLHH